MNRFQENWASFDTMAHCRSTVPSSVSFCTIEHRFPFTADQRRGGPPASILDSSGEAAGGEDVLRVECGLEGGAFWRRRESVRHASLLEAGWKRALQVACSTGLVRPFRAARGEESDAWPPEAKTKSTIWARDCERLRGGVFVCAAGGAERNRWCRQRGQRVRGGVWRVRRISRRL